MDNFKDAPPSVTEIKAARSRDGTKWTPRDVLIHLLRDIDNGMKVDALVCFYRVEKDDGKRDTCYTQSSPDNWTLLGLVEDGKFVLTHRD